MGVQLIAEYGGDVDVLHFASVFEAAVAESGRKGGGAGPLGDGESAAVLGRALVCSRHNTCTTRLQAAFDSLCFQPLTE